MGDGLILELDVGFAGSRVGNVVKGGTDLALMAGLDGGKHLSAGDSRRSTSSKDTGKHCDEGWIEMSKGGDVEGERNMEKIEKKKKKDLRVVD